MMICLFEKFRYDRRAEARVPPKYKFNFETAAANRRPITNGINTLNFDLSYQYFRKSKCCCPGFFKNQY